MVDNPHYYFCFLIDILLGNKLLHSNFYIEVQWRNIFVVAFSILLTNAQDGYKSPQVFVYGTLMNMYYNDTSYFYICIWLQSWLLNFKYF